MKDTHNHTPNKILSSKYNVNIIYIYMYMYICVQLEKEKNTGKMCV